ncbi:hypothetical protein [Bailinhaonella thermotolerans]|uniref:Uncharacterized protein n=1 Tax=Bailinhaonella thermotolerans TaxID=1070861 RepID=A0A3A4A0A7_9ACTN|nr:hypothetical protein [Bailinhaonella thermotolerans]RJL21242.1 hypothetical protein D5H75_37890 [Bailinhaonella thermotolerans]
MSQILGLPLTVIASLERAGAIRPTVTREFGDKRPALFDAVEVTAAIAVGQAYALGWRGAALARVREAIVERRRVLRRGFRGYLALEADGGSTLIGAGSPDNVTSVERYLKTFKERAACALLVQVVMANVGEDPLFLMSGPVVPPQMAVRARR